MQLSRLILHSNEIKMYLTSIHESARCRVNRIYASTLVQSSKPLMLIIHFLDIHHNRVVVIFIH